MSFSKQEGWGFPALLSWSMDANREVDAEEDLSAPANFANQRRSDADRPSRSNHARISSRPYGASHISVAGAPKVRSGKGQYDLPPASPLSSTFSVEVK